jgi:uncharacterized membrane protein
MYTVSLLVFYYFFYSALGWFVESVYCSLAAHKWINRGFLTGPLCPIYGAGAIVFIVCLTKLKETPIPLHIFGTKLSITPILVFFAGLILADLVEFFTSLIMEKLFHARWWDYSEKPFNIQGRICLQHTIYWGIASIVFLYLIQPFFGKYADKLFPADAPKVLYITIIVFLIIFILDIINAIHNAMDVKKVMDKVHKLSDTISRVATDIRGNVEVRFDGFQVSASKRAERFAVWRSDVSKQMSDIVDTFGSSIRGKNVKKGKFNRLINGYPNLSRVAKKQISSLEDLLAEIKKRITDDDDEMY